MRGSEVSVEVGIDHFTIIGRQIIKFGAFDRTLGGDVGPGESRILGSEVIVIISSENCLVSDSILVTESEGRTKLYILVSVSADLQAVPLIAVSLSDAETELAVAHLEFVWDVGEADLDVTMDLRGLIIESVVGEK